MTNVPLKKNEITTWNQQKDKGNVSKMITEKLDQMQIIANYCNCTESRAFVSMFLQKI